MLKSILCTDRDYKEAAVIEKRRKAEEERKQRFFNERQRVLGIDCGGLKQQLLEKEQKQAMEREELKIEADEMRKNLEIAESHEREMQEQRKKAEMEINEFRKNCQQQKDSSDFDLYDPNDKKSSLAARLDDNDARLSISGGQMFMGEDLMNMNRIREQKMLQKKWLDQQIAERKQAELNKKQAEKEISDSICKFDAHAVFMGNRVNDDTRDIKRQILEYNLSLAQQKRENDKKQKEQEQQDNLAEIYNFLSSDLLKENQPKSSNLGINRCIPYAYKHMTPEQVEIHRIEQEKQLKEIEKRKNDEENERRKWEEMNNELHRQMTIKERALSRSIRQMNHNIRKENEELAKEQKCKKEHYEKVVNTNEPTEDFFNQFNTTSR
ncbi:hypothetical protein PVAND_006672 [Polypedilum vanderplanki]|uniref:RIB43A-like with coiled-coils protein 2 n=1 Tax=Polypedilum vanderplanki TaxID=319348 RepID=A0A9J6C3Z1_POLVA|nr:hypothetical protein PVAND_006672 [Polypedilum vanderplanki]